MSVPPTYVLVLKIHSATIHWVAILAAVKIKHSGLLNSSHSVLVCGSIQ